MILGIDTSLGTAVALIEPDGVVRGLAESQDPRGHAEVIGALIVEALGADATAVTAGAPTAGPPTPGPPTPGAPTPGAPTTAAVTHVAVGMGPGPFTGLRVGIAAARTFALGRGVPVVPVVSHDAIALERLTAAAIVGDDPGRFAVVTDARRREVAYSVYDDGLDDDGLPVRTEGPALMPAFEADERLAGLTRVDAASVPPVFVALVAARALAVGRSVATDAPIYLRAPDVTVPRAPKRVSG